MLNCLKTKITVYKKLIKINIKNFMKIIKLGAT